MRLRCLKLLLASTDRDAAQDWAGALATLRQALDVGLSTENRDVWANLANMALHLGDDVSHRRYFNAMLSSARADGAVMEVLYGQHRVCFSEFAAGDWAAVRRSAEEAMSLALSIGHPALTASPSAWLCLLAALQGTDDYERRLEAAEQAARAAPPRHHGSRHRRPAPLGQGSSRRARGQRRRVLPPLQPAPRSGRSFV